MPAGPRWQGMLAWRAGCLLARTHVQPPAEGNLLAPVQVPDACEEEKLGDGLPVVRRGGARSEAPPLFRQQHARLAAQRLRCMDAELLLKVARGVWTKRPQEQQAAALSRRPGVPPPARFALHAAPPAHGLQRSSGCCNSNTTSPLSPPPQNTHKHKHAPARGRFPVQALVVWIIAHATRGRDAQGRSACAGHGCSP